MLFARSQMAVRTRNIELAFELAQQAAEREPERIQFLTWAGRLALSLDQPDKALEYLHRAWRLDPENHDLTLAYADLLARNGDPDGARRVMREMSQSPDVMLSRILFELSAQDRDAADQLFLQFLDMDDLGAPDERAFYQGQAAEALGLYAKAIELYDRVEHGEQALAATIRLAELKAYDGDIDGARAELASLRQQDDPAVAEESWLAESRILREAGNREEAYRVLDAALASMPDSTPILYSHALMASELGWVDIAERDLRRLISEQPENAAALNALGYTLADQTERYEEAEALIRQAYILQPNEASIIDSMGWVAYRLGRMEESIQYLRKAWGLDKNPEIAAHLGEVLWMTGDNDAAIAILREGRAVDETNPVLIETIDRLGVDL